MDFDRFIPLTDIVARIKKRDPSPVEILQTYLQRIERFNPELNAIVTLDADRAMEEPLTLTVRDAALLANVTFGPHEEDPSALPKAASSYLSVVDDAPGRLRIGYCPNLGQLVQPDVAREVEAFPHPTEIAGRQQALNYRPSTIHRL